MPVGGGKYDAEVEHVYASSGGAVALVIVLGGPRGAGFSCKGEVTEIMKLPSLLRTVADSIEEDQRTAMIEMLERLGAKQTKG